jgi:hypothetical protein
MISGINKYPLSTSFPLETQLTLSFLGDFVDLSKYLVPSFGDFHFLKGEIVTNSSSSLSKGGSFYQFRPQNETGGLDIS